MQFNSNQVFHKVYNQVHSWGGVAVEKGAQISLPQDKGNKGKFWRRKQIDPLITQLWQEGERK